MLVAGGCATQVPKAPVPVGQRHLTPAQKQALLAQAAKDIAAITPPKTTFARGGATNFLTAPRSVTVAPVAMPPTNTSVRLEWVDTNTDWTGFNVYYGTARRIYTNSFDVGDVFIATITGLPVGPTYFFAVTAFDTFGLESGYSNEKAWSSVPPNPQTNAVDVSTGGSAGTVALFSVTNPPASTLYRAVLWTNGTFSVQSSSVFPPSWTTMQQFPAVPGWDRTLRFRERHL